MHLRSEFQDFSEGLAAYQLDHLEQVTLKKKIFIYFNWRLITLQHCSDLCHTLT